MFLVNTVCNFVNILLFVSGLGLGIDNKTMSLPNMTVNKDKNHELVEPFANLTEKGEPETDSTVLEKSIPLVYTRQHPKESLEKIQVVNKGILTKSAFVPILPTGSVLKYSESSTKNYDYAKKGNSLTLRKDKSMNTSAVNSLCNHGFVTKNGKKYRVVKVRKNARHVDDTKNKNQVQRRTFIQNYHNYLSLPKFLSLLPVKWMTREKSNSTEPQVRSDNETQWSKIVPHDKDGLQNSEKIKKLINLFAIVKFDNGDCYVDGIKGTCLHQTECEAKGGKVVASCAEELGVCCYSEKTCGEASAESSIYFVNEGFPETSTSAPKVCTLTVEKTDPEVKQLRLDFLMFQLRDPINGTCLHDRLAVSGQDINSVVPEICGINTGQHIYIDVEDSNGPYNLNVITMGEYFARNFRIKVTQVKKDDVLLAPRNCLQFYIEPTGFVQTFNYQRDINENIEEVVNGYFNNLNYAICIKKLRSFCSISYQNEELDSIQPTFQLVNVDEAGEKLLPPRQAGAETFDCPDDYIVVNGIRLCGEKLNDASVDIDFTRNYPVTDTSNGPFILSVRTDSTVSGRGFYLKYMQNPCIG